VRARVTLIRQGQQQDLTFFFKRITVGSHLFQGVTDSTMTHGEGWDFIRIGKLLERADCTSRILDVKYHILLPSGEKVGGNIEPIQWMAVLNRAAPLKPIARLMSARSHRGRWQSSSSRIRLFPRSIRFSVDYFDAALHHISGSSESKYNK